MSGLARVLFTTVAVGAWLASPLAAATAAASQPPSSPDIWLHYDYMVGSDGHSDAPDPVAIQQVVDSFAAHGIELHIDRVHAAIPAHDGIIPDFDPSPTWQTLYCVRISDTVGFLGLKATYFHPTTKHEWHYVIFGESAVPCLHHSGYAELPGDNFVVGMAALRFVSGSDAGLLRRATAGTFMHELGHNLGLRHGGGDNVNFKPNYLSVMNYAFQFPTLPYAASPGSTVIAGFRADYSESVLPTLDEAHLDETKGIGGSPSDTGITTYDTVFGFGFGAASGAIDWNLDGHADERDVTVNLNLTEDCLSWGFGCDNTHVLDVLTGFDDWAEVHLYLAAGESHANHTAVRD